MPVNIKIEGLPKLHTLFDSKKVSRATVNAINQTATEYRKITVKEAGKIYNIPMKRIKTDSEGKPSTFIVKAKKGIEYAKIEFKGRRPGLHHFSPNKQMKNRKKSPKIKIKKADPLKIVERGFFQTGKHGVRGLYERVEGTRAGKSGRTVLKRAMVRRTGPSMKQMYEDPQIEDKFQKKIPDIFNKKFDVTFAAQFKGK